ncbi:nitroreductase family protein [Halanaerobaculum tunisiense]
MGNETLQTIKERRTARAFKEEQIKDEELEAILEAGMYAPSAHNHQSWHFTVVQNQKLLDEMSEDAKEDAKGFDDEQIQKMANNEKFNIFYDAPTVIIVSGEDETMMPEINCAAATENMLLTAESLDIGACWNGFVTFLFNGEKREEYLEKLDIPEGHTPYYGVALGYKQVESGEAPDRREDRIQYIS